MGNFTSKDLHPTNQVTIFDFKVPSSTGEVIDMNTFRGKNAYIIVNVASE
jgi:glutathione peroxidase-family protein